MTYSKAASHTLILPATEADVPVILELIKALAEFEKLSHLVVATEALLRDALFGSSPKAEVVLAWHQERPVGFALFFHNFSTFLGRHGLYLEDLFVRPEARGLGIGKALLLYLGTLAGNETAAATNGPCWTGTNTPSASTRAWGQNRWTTGPSCASPDRRSSRSQKNRPAR